MLCFTDESIKAQKDFFFFFFFVKLPKLMCILRKLEPETSLSVNSVVCLLLHTASKTRSGT